MRFMRSASRWPLFGWINPHRLLTSGHYKAGYPQAPEGGDLSFQQDWACRHTTSLPI